jgi:hypothetical protein
MELVLKSNNEESTAKIIALAKALNVVVEKKGAEINKMDREAIKNSIINFKAKQPSSFGDAAEWEKRERAERDLPLDTRLSN